MIYELSIIHKSQIINQNSFLFQFTIIDHMFGFTHTPLDAAAAHAGAEPAVLDRKSTRLNSSH